MMKYKDAANLHQLIRINGIPIGSYIIYNKILMPVSVWIEIPHNVKVQTIFNTQSYSVLPFGDQLEVLKKKVKDQGEIVANAFGGLFAGAQQAITPAGQEWLELMTKDMREMDVKAGIGDQPYFQSPGNISDLSGELYNVIKKENIKYIFSQEVDENRYIDGIPIIQLPQNNIRAARILYPLIHPGTMSDSGKVEGNANACKCGYKYNNGDIIIKHDGELNAYDDTTLVKYFSLAEADAKMAVLEEALAEVNAINTLRSGAAYTDDINALVAKKTKDLATAETEYNDAIALVTPEGASEGGGKKRKSKKSKKGKKSKKSKKGKKGKKGKKSKKGKNGKKNKSMKNKSMKNKSMKNKTKKN